MRNYFIAIMVGLTFFSACKKEDPEQQNPALKEGVFIVNQGSFNADNASLSYYVFEGLSSTQYDSLFYNANNANLGDVAQSINVQGEVSFIVINNSGLVYCIDNKYAEVQGRITGLTSPRNMLVVNDEKAYVSDLLNSSLTIINPKTYEITGDVPLNRTSEEMLLVGNTAFIANYSSWGQTAKNNVVMTVNTETDMMTDTIKVGIEPNSLVLDKDNNIWVLCSGGFMNEENPTLWKIDGTTAQVLDSLTFDELTSSPSALKVNGMGDELYFLNNGVFKMSIVDDQLPQNPFISPETGQFFAYLGVDPVNNHVYIGDPKDYQTKGQVYQYDENGTLVYSLDCGIIPAAFGFNY